MARILFCASTYRHRPYWISVLAALGARGHEVIVTFSDGAIAEDLSNESFDVASFPVTVLSRADHLMRELRTAIGYRRRKGQSRYYFRRWLWNLPRPVSRLVGNRITGAALVRLGVDGLLRRVIERKPASSQVKKFLRAINPDFVLASPANHFRSLEIECVKAAGELRVPNGILALSWDNLSTKGLFHAVPDVLFVWNAAHGKEAERIHGIPSANIVVSGSPFFEKWLAPERHENEQEALLERMGLKPGSRYVLYVGSTNRIAGDETWLVSDVEDILANNPRLNDMYLVVRPHPANAAPFQKIGSKRVIVWPRDGILPSADKEIDEFRTMLEGATVVVGVNTSAMVDAVSLDVPTVAFLAKRYTNTQERAVHFKRLVSSGALGLAETRDALEGMLNYVSQARHWRREERRDFVEQYIAPHGRDRLPGAFIADRVEERLADTPDISTDSV